MLWFGISFADVIDGSHDGIFSTLSAYYATEELYFTEHEVF